LFYLYSQSGSYPPFTKSRSYVPTQQPLNGGTACPLPEEETCLPDVCWTAESTEPSFGPRKDGMKPFSTLPPNHPAFTRTDCTAPLKTSTQCTADSASSPNCAWIPKVDSAATSTNEHCTGPKLFYALDPSGSGRTMNPLVPVGNTKQGVSQIMLMQDSDAQLYFGIMNGGPSQNALGGQNPGATADIEIEFTGINSQNQGVDWGVQNDPSLQPTNCKSSKGTGNDCYTWDAVSKKGKAEWAWKDGKTSGGMIGPLPSYDFCAILKRGDVKGIDTYEFASSFNDVSKEAVGSGSAPYIVTTDNTYVNRYPFNDAALDYNVKICTYQCALGPPYRVGIDPIGTGQGTSGPTAGTAGGTTSATTGGTSSGGSTTTNGGGSTTTNGGSSSSGGGSTSDGSTSDGSGSGTSSGTSSGSGSGTSNTGSGTSTGGGVIVTPATCSTGTVNAAGDGCAPTCSTGEVNAAGDGCAPSCSTGTVNADGDGCAPSCTTGAVNEAADGCTDPDATFDKPGTFEKPGEYIPPGEFTHAKDADGNIVYTNENGGGNGAMIGGIVGGLSCCLLLVVAALFVHKKKGGVGGGRKKKGKNGDLPAGWSSFTDESSGYPCYVNDATGDTQWDKPENTKQIEMSNPMKHSRNETELPVGWGKDGEGDEKYYFNEETGETSWDAPPGSVGGSAGGGIEEGATPAHSRNETILPAGWNKDESGADKFYYNEDGDTSWDAPEGSTGGSTGL